MNLSISEGHRRHAAELFGPDGLRWLEALPALVDQLRVEWSFEPGEHFDGGGTSSWVTPVTLADGSTAVLKLNYPERESLHEGRALQLIDGRSAVRVLRLSADGLCMLLERCTPGGNLWPLPVDEANRVAVELLPRYWQENPPADRFDSLEYLVDLWCQEAPPRGAAYRASDEIVHAAAELARTLQDSSPPGVLLHGDFHPANVLSASREPWLVIDPKPIIGDPAYDLAQWLSNRCRILRDAADPAAEIIRQAQQMSEWLDVDPIRAMGWTVVKAVGWDFDFLDARIPYLAWKRMSQSV